MKKVIPIGLFVLLLYHTLASVLVCVGSWWQAEHDLSEKLSVYRSVDSIVEFEIPMSESAHLKSVPNLTSEGFTYRGTFYSIISIETRNDTLYIGSIELKNNSLWQGDLLSFLREHVGQDADSGKKASQFLKLLLKEYSPGARVAFKFLPPSWREAVRIPATPALLLTRALPVFSPPPEV